MRIALAFVIVATSPAIADDVSQGRAICRWLDSTGVATEPCELDGWNSAVVVTIAADPAVAREMCAKIVEEATAGGIAFETAWTMQIRSPFSGENSIAFCDLP